MNESRKEFPDISIKVVIRKKTPNLPIFSYKNYKARIDADKHKDNFILQKAANICLFDIPLNSCIAPLKTFNTSIHSICHTPIPIKDSRLCYFNNPRVISSTKSQRKKMSADYRYIPKSVYSRTRQALASDLVSGIKTKSKALKARLTMKDLNLNLPTIIRSKRIKKEIRHKSLFNSSSL